ncbi:hypothetical protein BaRGS_00031977, partial [Batillaria attramentaria]
SYPPKTKLVSCKFQNSISCKSALKLKSKPDTEILTDSRLLVQFLQIQQQEVNRQ